MSVTHLTSHSEFPEAYVTVLILAGVSTARNVFSVLKVYLGSSTAENIDVSRRVWGVYAVGIWFGKVRSHHVMVIEILPCVACQIRDLGYINSPTRLRVAT